MDLHLFRQQIFPIRNKLFRFALAITASRPEAEDVVQEVFEKVWKTGGESLATVQNWEAWCMTLTRNRSIDKTRTRNFRRAAPLETTVEKPSPGASPATLAETGDLAERARQFMRELPEKQRLVMHLRDVEELTYEEISTALDISLEQVKINLHRARKSVREKLTAII